MAKDDLPEPKRRNRTMSMADVLSGALDPVLKQRGFASRDIITHWSVMAPKPYDSVAIPDKLSWPRGERSAEGATLVLRCVPGHALAIAHEGEKIAAAVNRYFGFVLVGTVRLSAEPFRPGSGPSADKTFTPSQSVKAKVGAEVADVENDEVREALRTLGHALASRTERRSE
ncbi:MAG: DUF721 domain-containing protein [Alphaproteobacteria bacterium]|nr:DUF721 domain-containing protein [Alphaproteobacteria bacterium]